MKAGFKVIRRMANKIKLVKNGGVLGVLEIIKSFFRYRHNETVINHNSVIIPISMIITKNNIYHKTEITEM